MFEWIRPLLVVGVGVAIFFSVVLVLYILEKFEILDSYPRKGFLPIPSTPGLRFFVGMLVLIYIFLIGLVVTPSFLTTLFSIGVIVLIIIMIRG